MHQLIHGVKITQIPGFGKFYGDIKKKVFKTHGLVGN
jgi:hypothetical protein